MKQLVEMIFPPAEAGAVPYWRLVLRGCSQFCFQTNELTGLFFLAAVAVNAPLAAGYLLVAGLIAPLGFLRGSNRIGLSTGYPGLNPGLMALSLATFFQTGWTNFEMWGVLIVCVVLNVVLVRLFQAILPFPFLILPFLLVFWAIWALEPSVDFLQPAQFNVQAETAFQPLTSILLSLGQGVFSPTLLSGILFLCGLLVSNVRHAAIAVLGAAIGSAVSYYYHNVDPTSVDLGLYGFNGVLAAVAAYVLCGGKLRLAILGALLATILTPVISSLGVQSLSSPFLFATWLLLLLGWLEEHWFNESGPTVEPPESSPNPDGKNV